MAELVAFIDDASRVCVHGQFFAREGVDSLVEALSSAFYKRGVPAQSQPCPIGPASPHADPGLDRKRGNPFPDHLFRSHPQAGTRRHPGLPHRSI